MNSGFLRRWSRRKQRKGDQIAVTADDQPAVMDRPAEDVAPEAGTPAVVADDSAEAVVSEQPLVEADTTRESLTDEDMPAVETLNGDSDYSPFLSEGVSRELRNLALKKLFFSGKFGVRDGLDDYDDDFTRFEPLGDTITSDMKFHQRRKERERLARLEEEERQRLAAEGDTEAATDEQQTSEDSVGDADAKETDTADEPPADAQDDSAPNTPEHREAQRDAAQLTDAEHRDNADRIDAGGGKLQRKIQPHSDHSEGEVS